MYIRTYVCMFVRVTEKVFGRIDYARNRRTSVYVHTCLHEDTSCACCVHEWETGKVCSMGALIIYNRPADYRIKTGTAEVLD